MAGSAPVSQYQGTKPGKGGKRPSKGKPTVFATSKVHTGTVFNDEEP